MKKGLLVYVLLVVFLLGVAYVVLTLSTGRTTFFGKASGTGVFNPLNSYLFASPLSARVGGERIRVTVFALDGQGKGIPNKIAGLSCVNTVSCQAGGVVVMGVQGETDTLGQAIFDVSASTVDKYELQAQIEGQVIPQTVTVSFQ
ncbi:MAG TPA: hypothetical protein VMW04_01290 [Patescibacteria group bacterium]|nr:hypothetical protein [Patescibacteria group bacterium]